MNLPVHSLKSDCPTRWSSTQLMIDRVLEQEAIKQILRADTKTRHFMLNIDVLKSVKSAFGPLDEFTDALSGEAEVTASAINAVLHIFETDVLVIDEVNDSSLTSDIKKRIMEYMKEKYHPSDTRLLIDKASYIDPRFYDMYLDDKERVKQIICEEGVGLLRMSNSEEASNVDSQSETDSTTSTEGEGPTKKRRKLGAWLTKARRSTQKDEQEELTPQQLMEREMEQYERCPRADPSSNPLHWWKVEYSRQTISHFFSTGKTLFVHQVQHQRST